MPPPPGASTLDMIPAVVIPCIRLVRRGRDVLPPDPTQAQGPEETWALIARLTLTLVHELEPERMAEVERGLASIADRVTGTTDLEMVVPELIDLLGGDGKALRALKMVRCVFAFCFCRL